MTLVTRRLSIVSTLLLAACAIDVGRLPMASGGRRLSGVPSRPTALARRSAGRSCVWVVGVFPIGEPSLGDAVALALDDAHAEALWDAEVRYHLFYVPPVGRACYAVEGRVP